MNRLENEEEHVDLRGTENHPETLRLSQYIRLVMTGAGTVSWLKASDLAEMGLHYDW